MPDTPPIVDSRWLRDHLSQVVVADVRWSMAEGPRRDAYRASHIPGAVFVDLDADLSEVSGSARGRHPLPTPEAFAAAMGRLGIGEDDTVVGYDDTSGSIAARLVWMLRRTGHEAALLDGGLDHWDGALDRGEVTRAPARFAPRPWPSAAFAGIDEVAQVGAGLEPGVVVDARARERYLGEVEPIDPQAGHVPGAINLPYADNLGEGGTFRDEGALRARFAALTDAPDAIVYCGSGVTACHQLLAMERSGVHARLFTGSWSAWSNDPQRPVATGDAPRVITLFHDFISPASAVAVLRVHTLLDEGIAIDVVGYQPLPLEVAIPPTLAVLEELERHTVDAASLGLTLRRPRRLPPTTGAHLVERLATEPAVARAFRDAVYRALWEDAADIADHGVLVDLARDAGLDANHVAAALADRAATTKLKQQLAGARSVHVGGVPALDVDGTLVSAFLPLDDLRQLASL